MQLFRFEAAHSLAGTTLGADAERVHGHSFRAEVVLRRTSDPTGMVKDFGALAVIRRMLDHRMLNRIAGLERPTLETLARYLFDRAAAGRCQSCPRHRLSRQLRASLQLFRRGRAEAAL